MLVVMMTDRSGEDEHEHGWDDDDVVDDGEQWL